MMRIFVSMHPDFEANLDCGSVIKDLTIDLTF
jgi:hypothetical protein